MPWLLVRKIWADLVVRESARLRQKHQQAVQAGAGGWVSNPISPSRVSTREKRTKNANWVNVTIDYLKKILPITLLRVIPTLAFQVIYSDPYFDILPNILSDIYSDILSGISSSMLSGIYFGVLSGIYSGILCGILSRIYFGGILCGIYSGSLSGIYSGIYSGIPFGRWGPAVPTELGRSQVEVQRCPLGSEGPWLRSSGAHCAQNLAVEVKPCPLRSEAGSWGPAVPTVCGSWRRD